MKDIQKEAPQAVCELQSANQSTNLIVNRDAPPFDNPEIRRAMALALDRKSFIQILAEGHRDIGGSVEPPPRAVFGSPPAIRQTFPQSRPRSDPHDGHHPPPHARPRSLPHTLLPP